MCGGSEGTAVWLLCLGFGVKGLGFRAGMEEALHYGLGRKA